MRVAGARASASVISASQASNFSRLRAFWRGTPPITPALQASRTSAGPVTRNIGAQIAGMVRLERILGSRLNGLSSNGGRAAAFHA